MDIKDSPKGSIILLHGCAHNPTGIDPTPEQWDIIADVIQEKGHMAFFDVAYQVSKATHRISILCFMLLFLSNMDVYVLP